MASYDRFYEHFDPFDQEMADDLHEGLKRLRTDRPVAHSDACGGYWVVTRIRGRLRPPTRLADVLICPRRGIAQTAGSQRDASDRDRSARATGVASFA